jgi:hypothetical protein
MPSVEQFEMCADNAAFKGTTVWRRYRRFVGQIGSSRVKFYADQCPVFSSEGRSTGLQRVFSQINGLVRAMRYTASNACNCTGELSRSENVKLALYRDFLDKTDLESCSTDRVLSSDVSFVTIADNSKIAHFSTFFQGYSLWFL